MPYIAAVIGNPARARAAVMLARATLGAEGELPPADAAWQVGVRARGHVPTRMPRGPNVGKLAERYQDSAGVYRYALASPAALEADGRGAAVLDQQIAAGARVQRVQDTIRDVTGDVLAAPRNALSAVLGIPPWAVTVAVLAGVVVVARTVLPALGERVRQNPPRGARRRRRRRSARR